jgi:putative ATP-dependent endonuclease of the OLD family
MYLSKIIIENFRGIKNLEATFNPSINFIIGENGSWVVSLLGAVSL